MTRSASHNHAPTRHPAREGVVRARLLLVLLVGLTLTSICQGHDVGDHRLAPHLAFLPEMDEHATHVAQAHTNPDTDAGPMYTIGSPGAPGAHDVASLGVALPLLALLGWRTGRRWPRPAEARPRPATVAPPDPPPPRQV
jgi:hypothetical protein